MIHIRTTRLEKEFCELAVGECFYCASGDDRDLYMKAYMEGPTKLVNAVSLNRGLLRNFRDDIPVIPEHSFSYTYDEEH